MNLKKKVKNNENEKEKGIYQAGVDNEGELITDETGGGGHSVGMRQIGVYMSDELRPEGGIDIEFINK